VNEILKSYAEVMQHGGHIKGYTILPTFFERVTCETVLQLRALVQRGSLTVWIADGFEKTWFYQAPLQRGSQFEYSAQAIEVMLTLKNVFHLPNRATEGFACSFFGLLKIALPVPDHTTLSRRGKTLKVHLPRRASGHLDIVMDSTGLKIYGEGERKVRTHGKSKR
jgi:hypothetical protein